MANVQQTSDGYSSGVWSYLDFSIALIYAENAEII
jgi:hypothetical protein